jgi:hypothetical protein
MKQLLFCLLITSNIFGQTIVDGKDYSLARVGRQIHGVYIFVNAEPYNKYEYVATVESKMNWSGTVSEAFEKVIKKANKNYPNFNGLIFHNSNYNKADLIRFNDLEITEGGYSINDFVSFVYIGEVYYGQIIKFGNKMKDATIQYVDNKGFEKLRLKRPICLKGIF